MGDALGTEFDVDITGVAHGGIMVSRHEGRVVMVSDAIPGERVRVRVSDDSKKNFWRADTVEVLTASPDRVPHVWAEADVSRAPGNRAGGAEFGHIALTRQRALKAEVVTDSLARFAKFDRDVVVAPVDDETPDGTGWRTRVRLHLSASGVLGPFAARSHRVIPVRSLPLATAGVNEVAPFTGDLETLAKSGDAYIDVIAPSASGARWITSVESQNLHKRNSRGGRTITEVVEEREFVLDEQGFWQVHRSAPSTLYRAVRDAVIPELFDPKAANLDLYGGVGLLAAALGERAGSGFRVTSVEANTLATDYAGENLSEWLGASAQTARVDRFLAGVIKTLSEAERSRYAAATVVVDPPRAGIGKLVAAQLIELGVGQIVYVACDPVAFARDLGQLIEGGYELASLDGFDLFPNTHHVETVAVFRKVGA